MKVELDDAGPLEKKLSISVAAKDVDGRFAVAYRELRKEIELPGFRRGKVPRKLLEKRFGERVAEEVAAELTAKALADAIAQHQLETVGAPELSLGEARPGEPLQFSATVALRPRPSVSDYCGIRVVREAPTLSDAELEGHLDAMRQQSGVLETVDEDRPAADGDVVDVTLTFQDQSYGDLVREHQLLSLPDDPTHAFVADLVRGRRRGETATDEVTIPSDYLAPDWAGRSCRAAVMIHEIKKLRPPPLDTAFAQRVGHETVEDLRGALRSELLEMMAQRGRDREVRDLIETLIERNPFDVPRPMVTDRAQALVASISAQLVDGMSQAMGMTLDDLEEEKREHVLEEAEFSVRRELILEAIGREEGIRLEDGERDAGIEEMAARTGQPVEGLRSALLRGGMGKFEAKLLEDKIIAWLLERAELVTEKAPSA
jgi:trigger factor